jgi:hypothetical protein
MRWSAFEMTILRKALAAPAEERGLALKAAWRFNACGC